MWEERANRTDMEVCPDTAGECCNRDAVETLSWYATVGSKYRCNNPRCSDDVISTKKSSS